jgi:hypothetical protein
LVVDGESGDLLDQLEQVDGRIEKRWLEFAFEVNVRLLGLRALDILGEVDKRPDMDCKLAED